MSPKSTCKPVLTVAELPQNRVTVFNLEPNEAECTALKGDMGLINLTKVRFAGEIEASGAKDWRLKGKLGATVVQPCVATLAPVKTRIEHPVERLFLADWPEEDAPEVEMPEDDSIERLTAEIDLQTILAEALALALPAYPRADGAEQVQYQITEPGKQALSDEDTKPFAGLGALRDAMQRDN